MAAMARGKRRRRSDSEITEEFSQTRTKMQNIIQRLTKATQRSRRTRLAVAAATQRMMRKRQKIKLMT
jgi:hypothetical protein